MTKTVWTQEIEDQILKKIRDGVLMDDAAGSCGVNKVTWREWRDADPALSARCDKALSECIEKLTNDLTSLSKEGFTNPAYLKIRMHLLGCYRRQLSARAQVEHSGSIGLTLSRLLNDDDEARAETP